MQYLITIRPTGEQLTARARSVEQAAAIIARRLYGRGTLAQRATGESGGSGVFGAYRYDRQVGASNHLGSEYHVTEQGGAR